tara:strand:+ start:390 stop:611 length:222 start_codon:yes stop_codon:yes gene_type:complete
MQNDHAQDRYDPPSVGSDFEEDRFSEINPGVVFRMEGRSTARQFRKVSDTNALDVKEQVEVTLDATQKVYVKS